MSIALRLTVAISAAIATTDIVQAQDAPICKSPKHFKIGGDCRLSDEHRNAICLRLAGHIDEANAALADAEKRNAGPTGRSMIAVALGNMLATQNQLGCATGEPFPLPQRNPLRKNKSVLPL